MSEFIREVDDEVRREQQLKLWRKYGSYAIGGAVVVVALTTSLIGWRNYQASARDAESMAFRAATARLEQGDLGAATDAFSALSIDGGAGYAALASLHEAQARKDAGDAAGAVAVLDRLANDSGAEDSLRQIAAVAALLQVMNRASDEGIEDRLAALSDIDSPWSDTIRELSGLVALQRGQTETARGIFADLANDPAVTTGVRVRAEELLAALGGAKE